MKWTLILTSLPSTHIYGISKHVAHVRRKWFFPEFTIDVNKCLKNSKQQFTEEMRAVFWATILNKFHVSTRQPFFSSSEHFFIYACTNINEWMNINMNKYKRMNIKQIYKMSIWQRQTYPEKQTSRQRDKINKYTVVKEKVPLR